MILSDDQLREIRERCEKATPGPWQHRWGKIEADVTHPLPQTIGVTMYQNLEDIDKPMLELAKTVYANADFIAAARSDIPHLLETIEVLKMALRNLYIDTDSSAVSKSLDESEIDAGIQAYIKEAEEAKK